MKRLGRLGRPLATTLALGLLGTLPASAQYTPQQQVYPGTTTPGYHPTAPQPRPTAPPAVSQTQVGAPTYQQYQAPPQAQAPTYPPVQSYQPAPNYQPPQGYAPAPQGYAAAPQTAQPYQAPAPQAAYPTTATPGSPVANVGSYPRTAMAPFDRYAMRQDSSAPPAVPSPPETLPTPADQQAYESVPSSVPSSVEGQQYSHPHSHAYPPTGHYPQAGHPYPQGTPGSYVATGDCNCDSMQGWNTYMAPYGHHAAGAAPCVDGGLAGCEVPRSRQWFFGAYALYMSRDNPGYQRLAVDQAMPSDTVLSTRDIEPDYEWGAEIRFGSTFGRIIDPCNPCAQRPYAWEVVYWGLTDNENSAMFSGMPAAMGTINYAGLEYDVYGDMSVVETVNYYFNYYDADNPMPNADLDSTVRVRNSFKAQNLELNFLRLPLYGGCEPCSPISVSTIFGVRYLKFDEDFQHSLMFEDDSAMPMVEGSLFHDIEVDNQLVGFQLGANMNWAIACKWDLFCDSMMGIYNNRIETYQRVYGGGGDVYFNGGMPAAVRAKKDDIAFMGELRTGIGYQVTGNFRLTAAYRVMAVTGVALAVEQIPDNWSNEAHVAWVDSNDSLILHGLQLGGEFKY